MDADTCCSHDSDIERLDADAANGFLLAYLPFHRLQYTYRPLASEFTTRVLLLEPAENRCDRLRGVFREVSLLDPEPYEALSYAWGSTVKRFEIELEGRVLPITESAHTLLLRIRDPHSQRAIWIDSVCINQEDNEEKSASVAMMGGIYSSAICVICWLGEDEEGDGAQTFDLVARAAAADYTVLPENSMEEGCLAGFLMHNNLPPCGDPRWYAASRFFERAWFRRQWVVQEMVLAPDAILMCGSVEVHWTELITGVNYMVLYGLIMGATATSEKDYVLQWDEIRDEPVILRKPEEERDEPKDVADLTLRLRGASGLMDSIKTFQNMLTLKLIRCAHKGLTEGIDPWSAMEAAIAIVLNRDQVTRLEMKAFIQKLADETNDSVLLSRIEACLMGKDTSVIRLCAAFMSLLNLYRDSFFREGPSLSSLVIDFPHSMVSDPRDRLYAFLGLSSEEFEPSLRPNYSESTGETYTRFSRWFLLRPVTSISHAIRNAMPLIEAGTLRHSPGLRLPSWATDFSHVTAARRFTSGGHGAWHVSGFGRWREISSTGNDLELRARAGRLDKICRVIPQPSFPPETEAEYRSFLDELDEMTVRRASREETYRYAKPEESWMEVQWRTLIANFNEEKPEPGEDWGEEYEKHDRPLFETFAKDVGEWDRKKGMVSVGWGCNWMILSPFCDVCLTEGGLIGLVPKGGRVGDEVWIIVGETMPFLLRKKGWEEVDEKFEIAGACYIHGIMQGEAMADESWYEENIVLV